MRKNDLFTQKKQNKIAPTIDSQQFIGESLNAKYSL